MTQGSTLKYSWDTAFDFNKLDDLTEAVGWGRRGNAAWEKIAVRSSFMITAWDSEVVVGLGRVVEDGVMGMFYDIAVHPRYQGQGVGSSIMKELMERIRGLGLASVGLFAWDKNPKSVAFYEKLGFTRVDFGMKLKRELNSEGRVLVSS